LVEPEGLSRPADFSVLKIEIPVLSRPGPPKALSPVIPGLRTPALQTDGFMPGTQCSAPEK
jgi:hypothetical protein